VFNIYFDHSLIVWDPAINPGSADTAYPTTCWHLSLSTNKEYARIQKKI